MLTGTPSVFVRLSGCNLRCRYCDTPYASWQPEGDDLSVTDVVLSVIAWRTAHVVLTGGEPMLFAELIPLCRELRQHDLHITIETAGTLYLPLCCDLMSISPKFSNSTPSADTFPNWVDRHENTRAQPLVIRQLIEEYDYQFKFVICDKHDLAEVNEYLGHLPHVDRRRVMLMPEGTDVRRLHKIESWLRPYCQQHGLVFCPRRQIEWFGNARAT